MDAAGARSMTRSLVRAAVAAALCIPAAARAQPAPTLDALIVAEDRRARTAADLAVLRAGAAASDAALRAHAVRGLGRLERPDVLGLILPRLADDDADVRERAAWSAAQAVYRPERDSTGEHADAARHAVLGRLADEPSAAVRDELLESAGRIRVDSAGARDVALALASHLPARGAVRGLYLLGRQRTARPALRTLPSSVATALVAAATDAANVADDVRPLAAAARLAIGPATDAELLALRRDPAAAVRATVASAAMLDDPAPLVRFRAVAQAECPALARALRDTNAHVALAAVDRMARCTDAASVAALAGVPHARAVVALAAAAPARARERLPDVVRSDDPFTRVYGARAARALGETAALRRLAVDRDPNVASEAIDGLYATVGRTDSALYLRALDSDASQLLMSAAAALDSVASAEPALLRALDRVTALRSETSRDARMALVQALGAAVPARYARDFDPAIAERAAALAGVAADPQPLPDPPVPTVRELQSVRGARIEMASGDTIELELFPMDAPTNVWRFVRLARDGWFDGLTLHRVAPFFVVQGGSPLANEYVGDPPFTRDELWRENLRGTVGLSTRGRDTGDGQLYFNTVDNAWLDHNFTVWARVVRGMDAVDRMQEGATIRRATVY